MPTTTTRNRKTRLKIMRQPVDQNRREQEDQAIVAQVLGGDVDAFEHLITKYRGHVTAIVRRHVPGDRVAENVQEAFVRAFQSLGGWKGEATLRSWLATIAILVIVAGNLYFIPDAEVWSMLHYESETVATMQTLLL